jgi:hypothetical protein
MTPSADTPLYNHPLPDIENWLRSLGCEQDPQELHHWRVERSQWDADIWLDVDRLVVRYFDKNASPSSDEGRSRSFQYSLSREDIEDAVFGEGVEQAIFGNS